jgi:hypothetical protein
MSRQEIRRRFRLVLLGSLVLAAFAAAAVQLNQHQTSRLDHHTKVLTHQARILSTFGYQLCVNVAQVRARVGLPPESPDCKTERRRMNALIDGG